MANTIDITSMNDAELDSMLAEAAKTRKPRSPSPKAARDYEEWVRRMTAAGEGLNRFGRR